MHTRRVGADDLHFTLDVEIDEATRAVPHAVHATTGARPGMQARLRGECTADSVVVRSRRGGDGVVGQSANPTTQQLAISDFGAPGRGDAAPLAGARWRQRRGDASPGPRACSFACCGRGGSNNWAVLVDARSRGPVNSFRQFIVLVAGSLRQSSSESVSGSSAALPGFGGEGRAEAAARPSAAPPSPSSSESTRLTTGPVACAETCQAGLLLSASDRISARSASRLDSPASEGRNQDDRSMYGHPFAARVVRYGSGAFRQKRRANSMRKIPQS